MNTRDESLPLPPSTNPLPPEYAKYVGTRTDVVLARMNSKNKDCSLDHDVWQLHGEAGVKSKLKAYILFAEHGKSQFPVPVSLQATKHGGVDRGPL